MGPVVIAWAALIVAAGAAVYAMTLDAPAGQEAEDVGNKVQKRGTNAGRDLVYGQCIVDSVNVYNNVYNRDSTYMVNVFTLGVGPIQAINQVYIDDTPVLTQENRFGNYGANHGFPLSPDDEGDLLIDEDFVQPAGDFPRNRTYSNDNTKYWMRSGFRDQITALETRVGNYEEQYMTRIAAKSDGEWTSEHRGDRVVQIGLTVKRINSNNVKILSGNYALTAKVQGVLVHDPRFHAEGERSWEHTDESVPEQNRICGRNPSICLLDYLTDTYYGLAIPKEYINVQSFMDVANWTDANELYIDGQLRATNTFGENLSDILSTFGGVLVIENGLLVVKYEDVVAVPYQKTLTTDNVIKVNSASSRSTASYWNIVETEFKNTEMDEKGDVFQIPADVYSDARIANDGFLKTTKLSLPHTKASFDEDGKMVGAVKFLANRAYARSDFQGSCELDVDLSLFEDLRIFDVVVVDIPEYHWQNRWFRVMSIQKSVNSEDWNIGTLSLKEYSDSLYVNIQEGVNSRVRQRSFRHDVQPPKDLAFTLRSFIAEGQGYLTWAAPNPDTSMRYQVEYKLTHAGQWTVVGESRQPDWIFTQLKAGFYDFRVASNHPIYGLSEYAELKNQEVKPFVSMPAPTNLEVDVTSNDFVVSWDDMLSADVDDEYDGDDPNAAGSSSKKVKDWFSHYEVLVQYWNGSSYLNHRTFTVTQPQFNFDFAKNKAIGTQRKLKFTVRIVPTALLDSPTSSIVGENPQIGKASAPTVVTLSGSAHIDWVAPSDQDYDGTEIHVSTDAAFTPSTSTRVAIVKSGSFYVWPFPEGSTADRYVKIGHFDKFGADSILYSDTKSAEYSAPIEGANGASVELRFKYASTKPTLADATARNQSGWVTDKDSITRGAGDRLYYIVATIDGDNQVIGTWSTPSIFEGLDGDTITIERQYSIDGSTNWHFPIQNGDIYVRERLVTNGVPSAWSEAARVRGFDGDVPSVVDNGDGTYTIDNGTNSITISNGNNGDVPTITLNADGTYTIDNGIETVTFGSGWGSIAEPIHPALMGGSGNMTFSANKDVADNTQLGEITVWGSSFIHPDGVKRAVPNRTTVNTPYEGNGSNGPFGTFYLIWSDTNFETRIPEAREVGSCKNVIPVRIADGGGWVAIDNQNGTYPITLEATDCFIAVCHRDFGSDRISRLTTYLGYTPIKGIDYVDGKDGAYVSTVFFTKTGLDADTPPNKPTGGSWDGVNEVFPSGWSDDSQYAGVGVEYSSTARYYYSVTAEAFVHNGWSDPAVYARSGADGADSAYYNGFDTDVERNALDNRTLVNASFVTDSYAGTYALSCQSNLVDGDTTGNGGTDNASIRISPKLRALFSGRKVSISVMAKTISGSASTEFGLAYSTNANGNSGWYRFTPTGSWAVYSFDYEVPIGGTHTDDYIIFNPDMKGTGKGVIFDNFQIVLKGDKGDKGDDAALYYISYPQGLAIKNGVGNITLDVRRIIGADDVALTGAGDPQLYINNVARGKNVTLNTNDISGSQVVQLKTGSTIHDSVTAIDVFDGIDAITGDINASNGLSFTKAPNGGAWTPSSRSTVMTFTFYKSGNQIASRSVTVNCSTEGLLTYSVGSASGDATNVSATGNNTQTLTLKCTHTTSGVSVSDNLLTAIGGDQGENGRDGLTPEAVVGIEGQRWGFRNSTDGWTISNANYTLRDGKILFLPTTTDPQLTSPAGLTIDGSRSYALRFRLRTLADDHSITPQFYWANENHGFSGSYVHLKQIHLKKREWTHFVVDVRDLEDTSVIEDYMTSTINRIRLDIGHEGKHYEIDGIVVGYFGAPDETDYDDDRISNVTLAPQFSDLAMNTGNFAGNPRGTILDSDGYPAGWKNVESGYYTDTITYNKTENAVQIQSSSDDTITAALPAFRVSPDMTYRVRVLFRGETARSSGLYLRMQEYNGELAEDKTHVGSGGSNFIQERTSYTAFYNNGSVPNTYSWLEYDYTPAAGVKWASFSFYNWSGMGNDKLFVRNVIISLASGSANIRNDSLTPDQVRTGANWSTLPSSGANNVEFVADGTLGRVRYKIDGQTYNYEAVSQSQIDSRANSRVYALRPDSTYKNSNLTQDNIKGGAGWSTLPSDGANKIEFVDDGTIGRVRYKLNGQTYNYEAVSQSQIDDRANSRVYALRPDGTYKNSNITEDNIKGGAGWSILPQDGATATGVSSAVTDPTFENGWITDTSDFHINPTYGEGGSKCLAVVGKTRTQNSYTWIKNSPVDYFQVRCSAGDIFRCRLRYKTYGGANGNVGLNLLGKSASAANTEYTALWRRAWIAANDGDGWHTFEGEGVMTSADTILTQLYFYTGTDFTQGTVLVDNLEVWKIPAGTNNKSIKGSDLIDGGVWSTLPSDGANKIEFVDDGTIGRVRYKLNGQTYNYEAVSQSQIDSRANSRIGALRPDSTYKNSNLTQDNIKGGAGWSTLPADGANKIEYVNDTTEGRMALKFNGSTQYIDVYSSGARAQLNNLRGNKVADGSRYILDRDLAWLTTSGQSSIDSRANSRVNALRPDSSYRNDQISPATEWGSGTTNVAWLANHNSETPPTGDAGKIIINSAYGGVGFVHLQALDAEGGIRVSLNGTKIGTMSGFNNELRWYSFKVTNLVAGNNTVYVWSTSADGGAVRGWVVTGQAVGDPHSILYSSAAVVEGRANERIAALRPDSVYKNDRVDSSHIMGKMGWSSAPVNGATRVTHVNDSTEGRMALSFNGTTKYIDVYSSGARTQLNNLRNDKTANGSYNTYHTGRKPSKGDVGLGSVDNKSSATLKNEAIAQAKNEALLRNPSGRGINHFNPDYHNPDTMAPITTTGNSSGAYITTYTGFRQPSGSNCLVIPATGSDAWAYLGKHTTDYNTTFPARQKWIVSFWVYMNSAHTNKACQMYIKLDDGSHHSISGVTAGQYNWHRISAVVDFTGKTSNRCLFRFDNDGGSGVTMTFDAPQMELCVDGVNEPTAWSPPVGYAETYLRRQRQIPMVNTAGANATLNTNPLSSYDAGSTATIDVSSHSIQLGDGSVSYNSGSISGLSFNTRYYVYCDDPFYIGGSVAYHATTNLQTVTSNMGRRLISSIRTTSNGGGTTAPDLGECVSVDMYLNGQLKVSDAKVGDVIEVWNGVGMTKAPIQAIKFIDDVDCVKITAENGCEVIVTLTTPITREDGSTFYAPNALGERVYTLTDDGEQWVDVQSVEPIGDRRIARISVGDISFAAGIEPNNRVVTHNATYKP